MKRELKQKWIEALRSGKYAQAREWLRLGNGYCCLGVLCDVAQVGVWQEGSSNTKNFYIFDQVRDDLAKYTSYTPLFLKSELEVLRYYLGLSSANEHTLIEMNDKGQSFNEIADWIEANVREED